MLNLPRSEALADFSAIRHDDEAEPALNLGRLLVAIRRQLWLVLVFAALGVILGIFQIATAVPLYTASIDILLDKARSRVIDEVTATAAPYQDEAETLSQVELLKSEQLSLRVVNALDLTENAVFMADRPTPVSIAAGVVGNAISAVTSAISPEKYLPEQDADDSAPHRRRAAVDILQPNVSVDRVGRTYVLRLLYTSPDPHLSAMIANGFGSAYLDDQLESKYDATQRASSWLQDRIAELKEQSFEADLVVQNFRTENSLFAAGGQLISEQQLSEITTQLVAGQAATAEAKAKLEQIENLIAEGQTDAVVNDALVSTTINVLRSRYLETSRLKAEIEDKLGPNHAQVRRLAAELEELERLVFGELGRIAESYRSSYNVALTRQQSLEASLTQIVGVNAEANTTQVQLRELEREAATFRSLYESFLQRYQETIQQQSFPISNARVIKSATPPHDASSPRKARTLLTFLLLGGMAGAGVGAIREYRDRFFRTGEEVRSELGVEFLGFASRIGRTGNGSKPGDTAGIGVGKGLWRHGSPNGHVSDSPLSSFAETLRNVKVAADVTLPNTEGKVIGVLSCLPGEGKSTISANFAMLLAMQGKRVVLLDCDLRNPGLTRSLAVKATEGMIELLSTPEMPAASILQWDEGRKLAVAPTIQLRRISHTSELLASRRMAAVLAELRKDFDYIVVDLPPVGPVVDAKAFAHSADAFLFVVEWGRTSRLLVRSVIAGNPSFYRKCLGVVLNKFDERKIKLYQSYGSSEYYASRYRSYYQQ